MLLLWAIHSVDEILGQLVIRVSSPEQSDYVWQSQSWRSDLSVEADLNVQAHLSEELIGTLEVWLDALKVNVSGK